MTNVPTVTLNGGIPIPQLGFGVFQVPPEETQATVERALQAGYRHIDTAAGYHNEEGVGAALKASGLDRDDVFVTTKLANRDHAQGRVVEAFEDSLRKLDLDQVDLYLVHWPLPAGDRYVQTWKALEGLLADGRARSIGVSNFQVPHLERLFAETDVVPAINQIELHPSLQQQELRDFHAEHGIVTEAWSPLAQGGLLGDDTIVRIAEAHGRTPAQVVLRWHLQLGNVVIPKSVTPSRMDENFDVFGFELTSEDLEAIAGLEKGERTGPDPDTFNPS